MKSQHSSGRRSDAELSEPDIDSLVANAGKACDFLKAMSHEPRLVMLCLLIEGEKTVLEIKQRLHATQPAVSQQLARLRLMKIVGTRRVGKNVYYSLNGLEVRQLVIALHRAFCETACDFGAAN